MNKGVLRQREGREERALACRRSGVSLPLPRYNHSSLSNRVCSQHTSMAISLFLLLSFFFLPKQELCLDCEISLFSSHLKYSCILTYGYFSLPPLSLSLNKSVCSLDCCLDYLFFAVLHLNCVCMHTLCSFQSCLNYHFLLPKKEHSLC
jgi:hypothetical protein